MNSIKKKVLSEPSIKKFTYLEPKLKTTSVFLVIFIIFFTFWIIMYYLHTYANWDSVKCNNGAFYVAPFFGKDSKKTLNECIMLSQEETISKHLIPVNEKIININDNIDVLKMKVAAKPTDNGSINSKLFDATSAIQQNILYVKNALSKILGAIVLSTNMNNGMITSTQALKDSSLSKMIKAFNDVVSPISASKTENIIE
jgi:hypothetical protein